MKSLYKIESPLGADGGKVGGEIGIEESNLVVEAKVTYPLAKFVEPAAKVADGIIDQIEKWIPGDQKAEAEKLKAQARAQLVAAFSEQK